MRNLEVMLKKLPDEGYPAHLEVEFSQIAQQFRASVRDELGDILFDANGEKSLVITDPQLNIAIEKLSSLCGAK